MENVSWEKKTITTIKPKTILDNSEVVMGRYSGTRERVITDRDTGELKTITDLLFKNENGELMAVPQDAGLRVAFSDALVKENQLTKVVKLPQITNSKGQPLNQYEVFTAQ